MVLAFFGEKEGFGLERKLVGSSLIWFIVSLAVSWSCFMILLKVVP